MLLPTFDPAAPEVAADLYGTYARLREATPIAHLTGEACWMLTRHADVHAAWRDKRLGSDFSHRFAAEAFTRPEALEPWRDPRYPHFAAYARWDLLAMEPPDHTKLRRLVSLAFTPRTVESLRAPAQALVDAALEGAGGGGELDAVRALAEPLSLTIICTLIGVPVEQQAEVLRLSHAVVQMYEPTATDTQRAEAEAAVQTFGALVGALIAARRAAPLEDLLSGLLDAMVDGDRLSDAQITSTVMVLLMAGHEASVNAASNGLAAFAAHPAQWAALRARTVPVETAIEEVLRWDPPLQLFRRWVLEPGVRYAGIEIPPGERIGLCIGSSNRDPRRYEAPDAFRIARGDPSHLAFGGGIHFCLGAPLARLELAVLLSALAARCPTMVLRAGASRRAGFQFRGYTSLPIALP
jgi:unspecific monooxygenase